MNSGPRLNLQMPDEAPAIDICVVDCKETEEGNKYVTNFTNLASLKTTTKELLLDNLQQLAVFIALSMDLEFTSMTHLNNWLEERGIPPIDETGTGYIPQITFTGESSAVEKSKP